MRKPPGHHTFMEAEARAPPQFHITFDMKKMEPPETDIMTDYMITYMNDIDNLQGQQRT